MKHVYMCLLLLFLFSSSTLYSQYQIVTDVSQIALLPEATSYKIMSGMLTKEVIDRNLKFSAGEMTYENTLIPVAIYYRERPDETKLSELRSTGVVPLPNTWIPPLPNHPLGFILAQMPSGAFVQVLSIASVERIAPTFETAEPNNNYGTAQMGANKIWAQGYTGTGVKIAILDSGLDDFYDGTDIPATYQKRDYSNYPTSIDDNVQNITSGHGTHVTGSVLGRGTRSNTHSSSNGTGPFKGSAPNADLVFLKIGGDASSSATGNAMIAAVQAAVDTFNAKIITMSYGGWDAFHDGSATVEQTFDWAVSRGVPCFVSAGNEAASSRHFSGTVAANSSTDYITINLNQGGYSSYYATFNLVYADGVARSGLDLQYFNSSFTPIARSRFGATESTRGTDQEYFQSTSGLTTATYYVKVVNPTAQPVTYHLYEYNGGGYVRFASPDPFYTSGHPSNADNVISVGAYVSRYQWWDYTNTGPYVMTGQNAQYQIANFSSRGPRVDGGQKPNIVAPGSAIISLRDTDVLTATNALWIDNDGTNGGDANYYVMQGTSMACPLAAGTAALYLQKNPTASPAIIKNAFQNFTSKSITEAYPNATWGYGKLDIVAAMSSAPSIDGYMADLPYSNLSYFSSGRNSFGDDNDIKTLKYYTDGTDIYIGITGELSSNDNLILFFNFSGYGGRGSNTLGNSGSDAGVFKNIGGTKLDFDADFALAMNEGSSTTNFYIDACRYGSGTAVLGQGALGNTGSQLGANAEFNVGAVFGGTGNITLAYHNGFASDSLRGIEMKIPITAFAGVTNAQSLELFAIITNSTGTFSNECIPGDPGASNLGNNPDFSVMAGGPFHTGTTALPVQLSLFTAEVVDQLVQLRWQTETEENAYQFQIERKGKGDADFTIVDALPASGNSNSPKKYSYTDQVSVCGEYQYRLKMIDNDGTFTFSDQISVMVGVPLEFGLSQNYPNPFNPSTRFDYQLPSDAQVVMELYDITGARLQTLFDAQQRAGYYTFDFSAPSYLSTGVYIVRMAATSRAGEKPFVAMRKISMVK